MNGIAAGVALGMYSARLQEVFGVIMKCITALLLGVSFGSAIAQELPMPPSIHVGSGTTPLTEGSNLPIERIGKNDLVGITVYDAPELTRPVRVNSEGDIRLPMLHQRIHAEGLYPVELEKAITSALTTENVMVDPIVTVSVVEYRSRPISVSGAVKHPVTFQATGTVTLLDAISQAEGLADNAGPEILVSRSAPGAGDTSILTQRISAHALFSGEDPALNLKLEGGEEIRIPEAGRVFVLGNVKKPGAFLITDGSKSSVLKALALSEGLDTFTAHVAYIYRDNGDTSGRKEIPIELKKILNRKSPDVALVPNDILYIPGANGTRATVKALETSVAIAAGLGAAVIYSTR